jgi:hypothetical protein
MARKRWIEYDGVIYHIMSCGQISQRLGMGEASMVTQAVSAVDVGEDIELERLNRRSGKNS